MAKITEYDRMLAKLCELKHIPVWECDRLYNKGFRQPAMPVPADLAERNAHIREAWRREGYQPTFAPLAPQVARSMAQAIEATPALMAPHIAEQRREDAYQDAVAHAPQWVKDFVARATAPRPAQPVLTGKALKSAIVAAFFNKPKANTNG